MEKILNWAYVVLETTPTRWLELVEKLPADLLCRPPAAGEWSAVDCLQHLVDAEQWVFPARIEAILAGQDFPAFDPDSQGKKSDTTLAPVELAGEFARRCNPAENNGVSRMATEQAGVAKVRLEPVAQHTPFRDSDQQSLIALDYRHHLC